MKSSRAVLLALVVLYSGCGFFGPDEKTQLESARSSFSKADYQSSSVELRSLLQSHPDNVEARLLLGQIYLKQGDGASAHKELVRAQELGLSGTSMELLIAEALVLDNRTADAEKLLTQLSNANEEQRSKAMLMLADMYARSGKIADAKQAYLDASKLAENGFEASLAATKVMLIENRVDEARKAVSELATKFEDRPEAWLAKGGFETVQANFTDAEASYRKALDAIRTEQYTRVGFDARLGIIQTAFAQGKADAAKQQISVLTKQLPNHPVPKYFNAVASFQDKDYLKAQEDLLVVTKLMDGYLPGQLLMGATQYALGQYEQAGVYLTKVVNAAPSHIYARKLLAAVQMNMRSPQDAVKTLTPLVKSDTTDVQLLTMIGSAAHSAGALSESETYYSRALRQANSPELRAELAKVYYAKGEYDEAIDELEKIAGDQEVSAKIAIAITHLKKGDFSKSLEVARKLSLERPEDAAIDNLKGGILLAQGERAQAIKSFYDALQKDKNNEAALLNLGRIHLQDGLLSEAENLFNKLLLANSKNLKAYYGLAQIAERRGNVAQAVSTIEQAVKANPSELPPLLILASFYLKGGEFDKGDKLIEEGLRSHPRDPSLLRLKAMGYQARGQQRDAVAVIKMAVEAEPRNVANYLQLFKIQRDIGEKQLARQTILQGIKAIPDALALKVTRVEMDLEEGNYTAAKHNIEDIKRDKGAAAVAYGLEGQLHMAQRKYSDAVMSFREAMKHSPSFVLMANLMRAHHKLGDFKALETEVSRWLKAIGTKPGSIEAVAGVYMELGLNDRAAIYYSQVLKSQPDNLGALNNLAWLYHVEQDYGKAIPLARKAYEKAPSMAAVVDTYGWLLHSSGQTEESLKILREANTLASNDPEIGIHLVTALSAGGNHNAEAKSLLDRIELAHPEVADRSDVQQLRKVLN